MFPENIVQMTFQRVQTAAVEHSESGGPTNASMLIEKRLEKADGINVLGMHLWNENC